MAGQPQNFAIFFFLFSNQRWWFGFVSVGWGCEELIDGVGICKKAISLLRVYKNIPLTLPSARPHMHIHIFLLLSHWYLICVFTIGRRNGQWLTGGKNQYISEWAKNVTILKKKSLMFMRARVERDVFSVSHRNVRTSSGFSLCPFRGGGGEPWLSAAVNILLWGNHV